MATKNIVEIPIGYYGQFNQGRPLFNADIFVGEPDTDPELVINQKQITLLLEDGTEVDVSQPVNTGPGGYISHNGSAATMFVSGNYSIKCLNSSSGAQEYFFENVFNTPASSGTGAARVDTVVDLIATNFSLGEFVDTSGYTTSDGGGSNSYEIVAGSTGTDDGGSFIDLNNGLQAKGLFPGGLITVKQFGAVGAGNDSAAFANITSFTGFPLITAGTYDVPTGDFSSVFFFSFGDVTITSNTTVRIQDLAKGTNRSMQSGEDLNTIGKQGFHVHSFPGTGVANTPVTGADGVFMHFQQGGQGAQLAIDGETGIYLRVDDSDPIDWAAATWRRILLDDGEITVFKVTDQIDFQGARGSDGQIEKNDATDRDELQVYSSPSAFSTGSLGSGINLYGNRDKEHAGNIAFLTGQDDAGTARMIISGGSQSIPVLSLTRSGSTASLNFAAPHLVTDSTWLITVVGADQSEYNVTLEAITAIATNRIDYTVSGTPVTPATGATITAHPGEGARTNTDTRVTIGNAIFDSVDNSLDTAMLNLKNPQGRPAINFTETNSTTEGELTVPTGEELSMGHWSGTVFTPRLSMDTNGNWISHVDGVVGLGKASNVYVDVWANDTTINPSDERLKQQIGPITDAVLDAWATVNYCQYKWNAAVEKKDIDGARLHFGLIAQRIQAAFEAAGLNPFGYGILGFDEWGDEFDVWDDVYETIPAQPAQMALYAEDEEGNKVEVRPAREAVEKGRKLVKEAGRFQTQKAGNRYSIRSTECLILEAALMRRTTALLLEELNKLKGV